MRLFGNAIQNYYGQISIVAPAAAAALTLSGNIASNGSVLKIANATDSNASLFIAGITRALRIGSTSTGATIDAVDAGQTVFEPLFISSSTLSFVTTAGATFSAPASGSAVTIPSGTIGAPGLFIGVTSPGIPFGGGSVASFNGGPVSFASCAVVIAGGTNPNNVALSVVARSSGEGLTINGQNVTGNSLGMTCIAGTNSSDVNAAFFSAAGTTQYFAILGDGGIVAGSPTGGNQGLGTINATGLFVNGTPVGGASGTFTGTFTGVSGTVTSTGSYSVTGKTVTLTFAAQTGTSNTNTFTITGLPLAIQPAPGQYGSGNVAFTDNTVANKMGSIFVSAGGIATFYLVTASGAVVTGGASTWTSSGLKGFSSAATFTYSLF
jgi:hypothetical protein